MKKIENIENYISAQSAALILTEKYHRNIRPDYISKMRRSKKHSIRSVDVGSKITLYHREDIAACTLVQKIK